MTHPNSSLAASAVGAVDPGVADEAARGEVRAVDAVDPGVPDESFHRALERGFDGDFHWDFDRDFDFDIDIATEVRTMEARARGLRSQARTMEDISAEAFRRRASALELMAFVTRSRFLPTPLQIAIGSGAGNATTRSSFAQAMSGAEAVA